MRLRNASKVREHKKVLTMRGCTGKQGTNQRCLSGNRVPDPKRGVGGGEMTSDSHRGSGLGQGYGGGVGPEVGIL